MIEGSFTEAYKKYGMKQCAIESKEYYRIITHAFFHTGLEHLLFNMLALIVIGKRLEENIGSLKTFVMALILINSNESGGTINFREWKKSHPTCNTSFYYEHKKK